MLFPGTQIWDQGESFHPLNHTHNTQHAFLTLLKFQVFHTSDSSAHLSNSKVAVTKSLILMLPPPCLFLKLGIKAQSRAMTVTGPEKRQGGAGRGKERKANTDVESKAEGIYFCCRCLDDRF